jgi:peptide/nickel transport system permease protein
MSLSYLARRVAGTVVLLFVLSVAVFALLRLAPGNLVSNLLGTRGSTPAAVAAVRARYHLDQSLPLQYWHWLTDALRLDFGTSIRTGESVSQAIGSRLALTAELVGYGFVIALVTGVTGGIAAGLRHRGALDRGVQGVGLVALSTPAFAGGLLLSYVFALLLGWLPAYGPGTGGGDRLLHLTLPAVTLGMAVSAVLLKLTRAAVIRELGQDHVTFARARGVKRRTILFRYVLRGTLLPVATGSALVLAYLLAGTVLVEQVYALPGLGALLVDSVTYKDLPVVQALALLLAAVICLVNLVTDLALPWLDPRLARQSRRGGSRPGGPRRTGERRSS